ncbi:hypothetical protein ACM01_43830 [Streptomyces viridochromogenes]|uniref:Uncharacterized protein n=1 Tax=Streptomyces viridochromogenes TaxID=1938 RepID=A0A0J7YTZ0_STRVR|nr:hypothetical protein ACM01_43830 [Streptomyces viridochromogenes]
MWNPRLAFSVRLPGQQPHLRHRTDMPPHGRRRLPRVAGLDRVEDGLVLGEGAGRAVGLAE